MNGFDWAIVFPVIFRLSVLFVCFVILGLYVYIETLTDDECDEIGYKRNRRG